MGWRDVSRPDAAISRGRVLTMRVLTREDFPVSKAQIGVWILLTGVIMLFAGLSSAYIVLRGVPNWQNIELPSLLWPNTLVLLLSSVAIDIARRAARRNDLPSMKRWLALGGILGVAFLVGQLAAWRQLM